MNVFPQCLRMHSLHMELSMHVLDAGRFCTGCCSSGTVVLEGETESVDRRSCGVMRPGGTESGVARFHLPDTGIMWSCSV